ncbi:MAG: MltR family transcriptional regulator [Bauldia sp.]
MGDDEGSAANSDNPVSSSYESYLKANPHLREFLPFLEQLNKESPRGAVLISAGYLEEQLRRTLLAFMRDVPTAGELTDGSNAPLGTLSARIAAAFALGLIDDREHHDLNIIRKVRNEFAHSIHASFDDQSISDRCANLLSSAHNYGTVKIDANGQFVTAATALILNLVNRPHYVGQQRLEGKRWTI